MPREVRRWPGRPVLMFVTGGEPARGRLRVAVDAALAGGVDVVQLRERDLSARALLDLAKELRGPTAAAGARLVVNDRVDVALAAGADGVHLRRNSLPLREARRMLGPKALVGISAHEENEVTEAFRDGADYVVFGPVFPTPSKEGLLEPRGPERYRLAAEAAAGPVLAIGGVSAARIADLRGPGGASPAGAAVIRAILDAPDPADAARALRRALDEGAPDR